METNRTAPEAVFLTCPAKHLAAGQGGIEIEVVGADSADGSGQHREIVSGSDTSWTRGVVEDSVQCRTSEILRF